VIGVDTNVLVRLLTRDDPVQTAKADTVFRKASLFISETVLLETEWVLRYAYALPPESIYKAFFKLCGLPNVTLSNPIRMRTALEWYSEGMDFADALHLALCQDCREFFTFDLKLIRKAQNHGRCKVIEP